VTIRVVWLPEAMSAFRRLRDADPDGATRVAAAIGELASDPRPPGATPLGGSGFHRLRLGSHRVLYEVDAAAATVFVVNVGSVPGPSG
jgi:mRNA interferase RelE/StbE